jgi:adenylate cyclase
MAADEQKKNEQENVAPTLFGHAQAPAHHHAPAFPVKIKVLQEIQRRNLVRVAVLYIIACWVILEPTHLIFFMLEVPVWANRLVILLMVAGLPLVLLFSWVYEVTPEGIRPTAEVDPTRSITHKTAQRLNRAIVVTLGAAVVILLFDRFWPLGPRSTTDVERAALVPAARPAANEKSIVVLPFTDMSEKHDQEYFSDGLTEELIDHLAHSPDLKVIARTSAFAFKGKSEDVRTIAEKLGVSNLLEGSVRRSGQELRITAQLIRAANGTHLWSQTYDRKFADVFKVQDEIASTVARALEAVLVSAKAQEPQPANMEAYNTVLRARHLRRLTDEADVRKAETLCREAIALDPKYAAPWIELATVYNLMGLSGWLTPTEAYRKAREALDHANRLDANLAEVHAMRSILESNFQFDFELADKEMRTAESIDPSVVKEFNYKVIFALSQGRLEDATELAKRQVQTDPLSVVYLNDYALTLDFAGRLDEEEKIDRNVLELNPRTPGVWAGLADIQARKGDAETALKTLEHESDPASRVLENSIVLWQLGRKGESDAALKEGVARFGNSQAFSIAICYARRGDRASAIQWLDRGYGNREAMMTFVKSDPEFRMLHDEPGYQAIVRKMRIPDTSA